MFEMPVCLAAQHANVILATSYVLNLKPYFKNVSVTVRNAFQTDFSITVQSWIFV